MLLDDYGAIVEFRPGKESGNVDALSRIPERALMIVALEDRLVWWREAQAKDKDCQALLAWIGGKSLPERLRTGLNRHDFVTESDLVADGVVVSWTLKREMKEWIVRQLHGNVKCTHSYHESTPYSAHTNRTQAEGKTLR
ncbi:hypothetical protein Pelo_2055 [Pelomyxa schiedti]|nr:hypothetical protein Pelo_2055 [Pelomyxa schiedti]